MIGALGRVKVYAYCEVVDMRKGIECLSGLVRESMKDDPLSGALFLFINRRRDLAKVLYFDGTGMCLLCKRLEKGNFVALWKLAARSTIPLTRTELGDFEGTLLVDGYKAYDTLAKRKMVIRLAHCWAHVRRKFLEAEPNYPQCSEALDLIGQLFELDRDTRDRIGRDDSTRSRKLRGGLRSKRACQASGRVRMMPDRKMASFRHDAHGMSANSQTWGDTCRHVAK